MQPLKELFSPDAVRGIAQHFRRVQPGFDDAGFVAAVLPGLGALELKARAILIAAELRRFLPEDPGRRAAVLRAVLHPDTEDHADKPADDAGLCGWAVLPLTMIVGTEGVDDFDRSMALLREMTMRFTAEFGVRHFLLADQARALAILTGWQSDPNRHVRRLISEGTRPRLPWAMRLPGLMRDPGPILPLLEALRDDPEPYVRRSVANHLNDISKDHPALVAALARRWMAGADKDRRAVLRHACRGLIKAGDPAALAVFGRLPPEVEVAAPEVLETRVQMGGSLAFSAVLRSTGAQAQSLCVDYVVHFQKANGRLAPKVFKGSVVALAPGEVRVFRRCRSFRGVTTRRHYPGPHAVGLRINGVDTDLAGFVLEG